MTIECKLSGKYLNVWKLKEKIEQGDSSVDVVKFIIEDYVEGYAFNGWSWWLRFKTSLSEGTLIRLDDFYDSENKRVILTWIPTAETFTYFSGSVELQICGSLATEQGLLKWNSNTATLKIGQHVDLEIDEKVTPDLFEQYLAEFERVYGGVVNDFKHQLENFIYDKQSLQNQITDEVNRATTKENELEEKINNIPNIDSHITDYNNPHKVSKSQIGLGNVDNTRDLDKPVSTAQEERIQQAEHLSTQETARATSVEQEIKGYINTLYHKSPTGETSGAIDEQIKEEESRASTREDELEELINSRTESVEEIRKELDDHTKNINNPHNVTIEQLDGIPQSDKGKSIPTLDSTGRIELRYIPFGLDNFQQGWYYNGKFYTESSYKIEIEASVRKIYLDKGSAYAQFYCYDGEKYYKVALADFTDYYNKTAIDGFLNNKVDKENGKGLSSNDYTSQEKSKLSNIENNAQKNKLESISVDGSSVHIDENKNANIHIPDAPVQSISVNRNPITPDEHGNIDIEISSEVGAKGATLDGTDLPFDERNYIQIQLADKFDAKVDKEEGKGLSANDFTNELKDKLDSVDPTAEPNVIEKVLYNGTEIPVTNKEVNIEVQYDTELNATSINAVQNKVLNTKFAVQKIQSETYTDTAIDNYSQTVDSALDLKANIADLEGIPDSVIDAQFGD